MDGMDGTRADSIDCLRVPGLHLPKAGIVFSTLLLQILTIQACIRFFDHILFARFSVTPIVSQMFAGVLLSPFTPWTLDLYYRIHIVVFPKFTRSLDESLAMLSYTIYTFLIAVKMDFSIVLKTGRRAFAIGILDVLIPIIIEFVFLLHHYPHMVQNLEDQDKVVSNLYINLTTLSLTHFPNIAVFLYDMKMVNSELGRLALSSALIGHILSAILLIIANVVTRRITSPLKLAAPFLLVILSIFVFRPFFKWMVKQTPKGMPVKQVFVYAGILIMFAGALATQYAQQLVLLGAFIIGSAIPDGPPLGAAIVDKLDFLVTGFLLPFFVTTACMAGDYNGLEHSNRITFHHLSLAILAYLAKFANSFMCGLYNKMNISDALALSFVMSVKGIVDIGTLTMFRESEVLDISNYTVMIIWTMFIATVTPFFVRSLYQPLRKYAGYQRRDIIHCKYNSELRILACFIRSDSVTSFTQFLNVCGPSENNPIVVNALHLVKLVGRTHPIFIAHDMQRKKDAGCIYSQDVIWAFHRFTQACNYFLSIHIFTAVSPPEAMHEDMCTLALDKLVSIIILPFHTRFRLDGSIEFEDIEQKILNTDILNRSPCSVGILVDRGSFRHSRNMSNTSIVTPTDSMSPFLVAVIYIGGLDDQETLSLAKRMGRDSRARVCVIRLVAFGQSRDIDPLDSAALMDIQRNILYNEQFSYSVKVVKDGAETATFLISIVESYSLIMVGRHYNLACTQLMGLKEMSEDTDLGAIGDFLASGDLHCKTSVLVVQQQRHWNLM